MVDDLREPGGLREQIAATIREHGWVWRSSRYECIGCDWTGDVLTDHDEHVADAVGEALGLEEEWNVLTDMGVKSHSPLTEERARHLAERFKGMTARRRWVSGWSVVAGEK